MADLAAAKQSDDRPAHLFKPGVSGNPKGRPKGTVQMGTRVRQLVPEEKLAQWYVDVWQGKVEPTRAQEAAAGWLTERGWGKAAPLPEVETGDPLGLELDVAAEQVTDRVVRLADLQAAKQAANGSRSNGRHQ